MKRKFAPSNAFLAFSTLLMIGFSSSLLSAQDTGGLGGLGGDNGGFNFGGGGGDGGFGGFGDFGGFQLQNEIEIEPSLRLENGFIGVRSTDLAGQGEDGRSQGFIGLRSGEGEFGGGNNGVVNQLGTNAGRQGGAATGGVAGGFQGVGNSLFFEVQRQGLRTRLSRNFISRTLIQGPIIGTQFVSRMNRIPQTRAIANSYNISVSNRTATITGTVVNQAQADKIVRQLRLEPGVYRINNQLQVRQ